MLRAWQAAAFALPQPLSEVNREAHLQSYIFQFSQLVPAVNKTRKQAAQALKNYFNKARIAELSMARIQNLSPEARADYDAQKKTRTQVRFVKT